MADPFALSREDALDSAYPAAIAALWQRRAWRCDFEGVAAVPIAAVAVERLGSRIGIVVSNGRAESFIKCKELAFDPWHQGFLVYMLDHRGQGLSSRLPADHQEGHARHFDDHVADLKSFVDRTVLPRRHERLVLPAHAMGRAIANLYLEQHPADFDLVALSSPMHGLNTGRISDNLSCRVLDTMGWLGRGDAYAPGEEAYDNGLDIKAFHPEEAMTYSEWRWRLGRDELARADGQAGWSHDRLGRTGLRRGTAASDRHRTHRPCQFLCCKRVMTAWSRRKARGILRRPEPGPARCLPPRSDRGGRPSRALHRSRPVPAAGADHDPRLHRGACRPDGQDRGADRPGLAERPASRTPQTLALSGSAPSG